MKYATFAILVFFAGSVSAQQILQHPKKVYTSPDGKLFFNKHQPVYFRISDSPDESEKSYLMTSEQTPQYSNPMYFDTEGRNTLHSPEAVDTITKKTVYGVNVIYNVYADGLPPNTEIKFNNTNVLKKPTKYTITNGTEISFKATDAVSGVEQIYVSIDKQAFKQYTAALLFNEEKEFLLQYYAVDHTGNVEPIKQATISNVKTIPESKLSVKGDQSAENISIRSLLVIEAQANLAGTAGIYYSIDSGAWKTYLSPISVALLQQGEHIVRYYAIDNLKNKESIKNFSFFLDITRPVVVEEVMGKNYVVNGKQFTSGHSKLKITSFDNKSGVKEIYYSINGAAFQLYDKPVSLVSKGTLNISTYALDNVNNKSQSNVLGSTSRAISYVDLSGPALSFNLSGPVFRIGDSLIICSRTSISFVANDAEAGLNRIEYRIDNADPMVYTKHFQILSQGPHNIKYYAYDNVENINSAEFNFLVDTTGPTIFTRFSVPAAGEKVATDGAKQEVFPKHVVVFLSATDDLAGYESMFYSINGMPEKAYTMPIKEFFKEGVYVLKVRSFDKLGNGTTLIYGFTIN